MYSRFLKNKDYLGLITQDALTQLIRGDENRFEQAEMSAEMSMVEYLSDNFEIEKVLEEGKSITEYNRQITYPVNSHFIYNGVFYKVINNISGNLRPTSDKYWVEAPDVLDVEGISRYLQLATYYPNDIVIYNDIAYKCVLANGMEFGNIQVPGIVGWKEVTYTNWNKVEYDLWNVVKYGDHFYTLINKDGFDILKNPIESNCWGMIGNYDDKLTNYELSDHEYVVLNNKVYYPIINVNPNIPTVGTNIYPDDPRNANVKKHLLQLSLYELHKLISPNNVSEVRITDYETSIQWLRDASRLKLNPHIPRKVDEDDNKPVLDWQVATFQKEYNPNDNPWQI